MIKNSDTSPVGSQPTKNPKKPATMPAEKKNAAARKANSRRQD